MDHRSDPHPERLQLVENKTGTPDLAGIVRNFSSLAGHLVKTLSGDPDSAAAIRVSAQRRRREEHPTVSHTTAIRRFHGAPTR
ncbi:hypothetical protein [Mycobacterium sp. URHB0021]